MKNKLFASFEVDAEKFREEEGNNLITAFSWVNPSGFTLTEAQYVDENSSLNEIYMLLETREDGGLREFNILKVSPDKNICERMMRNLIDADVYGRIEKSGIKEDEDDFFETNYDCIHGFVRYEIIKKNICFNEKRYTFAASLCDGKECGTISVVADSKEAATDMALCQLSEQLAKALPNFDIEISVRLEKEEFV